MTGIVDVFKIVKHLPSAIIAVKTVTEAARDGVTDLAADLAAFNWTDITDIDSIVDDIKALLSTGGDIFDWLEAVETTLTSGGTLYGWLTTIHSVLTGGGSLQDFTNAVLTSIVASPGYATFITSLRETFGTQIKTWFEANAETIVDWLFVTVSARVVSNTTITREQINDTVGDVQGKIAQILLADYTGVFA